MFPGDDAGATLDGSTVTTFPRSARLTRPSQFEATMRKPDYRLKSGPLRIAAVRNRMPSARLGLVVGKKAIARAHARNRVKRIIRDRFRHERFRLGGVDLVVRVVGRISAPELHRRLEILFAQLECKTPDDNADADTEN